MKNSDEVISELSNELAVAILLERKTEEPEKRAKILIETLRNAAEMHGSDSASDQYRELPTAA